MGGPCRARRFPLPPLGAHWPGPQDSPGEGGSRKKWGQGVRPPEPPGPPSPAPTQASGSGKEMPAGGLVARGPGGWRRLFSSPELAFPSPRQMTRPPPGSPRQTPFCPTLFTHSSPLLPILAPAKFSCTFGAFPSKPLLQRVN